MDVQWSKNATHTHTKMQRIRKTLLYSSKIIIKCLVLFNSYKKYSHERQKRTFKK